MKKLIIYLIILLFNIAFLLENGYCASSGRVITLGPNSIRYKKNLFCPLKNNYKGLTSNFGYRSKRFHEGIDMKALTNTFIYASHDGSVVYSASRMSGYGNMIVIKGHGIMTIYAHNNRNLVKRGKKVHKGDKIALVGSTGRVTGPHLHYEVRIPVNGKWYAVNPTFFDVCR